jgi:hypothetical protein
MGDRELFDYVEEAYQTAVVPVSKKECRMATKKLNQINIMTK